MQRRWRRSKVGCRIKIRKVSRTRGLRSPTSDGTLPEISGDSLDFTERQLVLAIIAAPADRIGIVGKHVAGTLIAPAPMPAWRFF